MKIRITVTVDVDENEWRESYPRLTATKGSVRSAVHEYVVQGVEELTPCKNGAIRSVTVAR